MPIYLDAVEYHPGEKAMDESCLVKLAEQIASFVRPCDITETLCFSQCVECEFRAAARAFLKEKREWAHIKAAKEE